MHSGYTAGPAAANNIIHYVNINLYNMSYLLDIICILEYKKLGYDIHIN